MMHIRPRRQTTKYGDSPICLVLAPTRELACQIEVETNKVSLPCGLRTKCTANIDDMLDRFSHISFPSPSPSSAPGCWLRARGV